MKRTVKVFGGLVLIILGASFFLGMIGIHIGGFISLAIGAWLMYWGYSIWQEKGGASFSSVFLLTVGGIIAIGGLGGLFSLLLGIALIYGGYRLLKKNENDYDLHVDDIEEKSTSTYDFIDAEFEKLMNDK